MSINELRKYVIMEFGFRPEEVTVVSGAMGVPISFLDKYCPEQFEIVQFRKGDDGKDLIIGIVEREREREQCGLLTSGYSSGHGNSRPHKEYGRLDDSRI